MEGREGLSSINCLSIPGMHCLEEENPELLDPDLCADEVDGKEINRLLLSDTGED